METQIKIYTDEELKSSFINIEKEYVNSILKFPLLSEEEKRELAIRKNNGDLNAREKLINSNLRLVLSVAKKYEKGLSHMKTLDIIDEGNIGLIKAVDKYNPDKSAFSTYACSYIDGYIKRALKNEEKEIRIPEYLEDAKSKYLKLINICNQQGKEIPEKEELCIFLNIPRSQLELLDKALQINTFSSNQKLSESDSDGVELQDTLHFEETGYNRIINKIDEYDLILILKEILSPFEYYVIYKMYIQNNQTKSRTLAQNLCVTTQRIYQKERKALKKIKPFLEEDSIYYKKVKKLIIDREGNKINNINIKPLEPANITLYFYLNDSLTDIEKIILNKLLFGKYNFNREEIQEEYNISEEEITEILLRLEQMINKTVSSMEYKQFELETRQKYKAIIFNLIEPKHIMDKSIIKVLTKSKKTS